MHRPRRDAAIRQDGEAHTGDALLVQRRTAFLRDQWQPAATDIRQQPLQVLGKIDALRVRQDLHAGLGTALLPVPGRAVVATFAAPRIFRCLLNLVARALRRVEDVLVRRRRGRVGQRLVAWRRRRRRGRCVARLLLRWRLLLRLWRRRRLLLRTILRLRLRCGRRGCSSTRLRSLRTRLRALRLRRVRTHVRRRLVPQLLLQVGRDIQVRHLLLLVGHSGDEHGRMPQVTRAVDQHPSEHQPHNKRDVDRLAKARTRALIVDLIQQRDQLMRFQVLVARTQTRTTRPPRWGLARRSRCGAFPGASGGTAGLLRPVQAGRYVEWRHARSDLFRLGLPNRVFCFPLPVFPACRFGSRRSVHSLIRYRGTARGLE